MDLYGIDVLLDDTGDLAVNAAGQLCLTDGPTTVAQALLLRISTSPGELSLHPDYGNALARSLIGSKSPDPTLLNAAAAAMMRQIVAGDRRMLAASVSAAVNPADLTQAQIALMLQLAGGEQLSTGDLTSSTLNSFVVNPTTVDSLSETALSAALGDDPDAALDELPDLDDLLEGNDASGVTSFNVPGGPE